MLEKTVHARFKFRLLEKCFWSLKTNLSVPDTLALRTAHPSYAVVRLGCDLAQISKRFILSRRDSVLISIRRYQCQVQFLLKKLNRKAYSFKNFKDIFFTQISVRSLMEQKLLLKAFEKRGSLGFSDSMKSSCMIATAGETFTDPMAFADTHKHHAVVIDKNVHSPPTLVPSGYLIHKFKFAIQVGMGLVGWQIIWSADSGPPVESPIRGKLSGVGLTVFEVLIQPFDFVTSVEFTYEGPVILGIRIHTLNEGWLGWVGTRKSITIRSQIISVNNSEQADSGYPRQYLIGLGGCQSPLRVSSIIFVFRDVWFQHAFRHH